MKHLGLFEGIGGFSLAARWIKWDTVAWCEIDSFCQRVLKYYFPEAESFGDIKQSDFSKYANKIDILTGGFPCQPYSVAGKRKGKEDARHLWPEMLRAIREVKPRYVVGENVRGLVNWNEGMVFDQVQTDLENEGYEVLPVLLPACAVNAPHKRERIWFIAHCNGINSNIPIQQRGQIQAQNTYTIGKNEGGAIANPNIERYKVRIQGGQPSVFSQAEPSEGCKFPRAYTAGYWAEFPTKSPVCVRNDGISDRLDGIAFSKWRSESIKAAGNAIVPQLAYQLFKVIEQMESIKQP